jgi:hypothetical protein
MGIANNKDDLLKDIKENYKKLMNDLIDIPDNFTQTKTLIGHRKGSKMSVCNLIAYLIGWGNLVLKWHDKMDKNEEVDFPEAGFKWTELGLLAEKFYSDYKNKNYKTLIKKLDSVVIDIINLVNSKNNDRLYGKNWYRKCSMGQMIRLNTASPYRNARNRIRKWKKENGYSF